MLLKIYPENPNPKAVNTVVECAVPGSRECRLILPLSLSSKTRNASINTQEVGKIQSSGRSKMPKQMEKSIVPAERISSRMTPRTRVNIWKNFLITLFCLIPQI